MMDSSLPWRKVQQGGGCRFTCCIFPWAHILLWIKSTMFAELNQVKQPCPKALETQYQHL